MKYTIYGAGAIGGVIGAYLSAGGVEVEYVDIDKEHVQALNTHGLTIKLSDREFTTKAKAYTPQEFSAQTDKLDVVLLCVKAHHTQEAIATIAPRLATTGYVVSFQNGLCEFDIAAVIGAERTVGCFVNLFADYIEPGVISYGGQGAVYIGELNGQITERVQQLVQTLSLWGPAQATDNIFGYLWSKLAYGAILITTALTNETIADVLELRANQKMLFDLGAEILTTADYYQIQPLGFDDWNPSWAYPVEQRNWTLIDQELGAHIKRLRSYTKTRTGVWRDLAVRKRKTEVPAQLEPIVAKAEQAGIAVPLLQTLIRLIQEIEQGKRELDVANLEIMQHVHRENYQ